MKHLALLSILGGAVLIVAGAWQMHMRADDPGPGDAAESLEGRKKGSVQNAGRTEELPTVSLPLHEPTPGVTHSDAGTALSIETLPTTPQELSSFLAARKMKYGTDVFYAAIERLYNDERPDVAWASKVEDVILGLQLPVQGECHASLCIYRLTEEVKSWKGNWRTALKEASRKLAFGGPDSKVEIEMVWNGERAGTMYILDREPPAAYAEPLSQMLPLQGG